MLNKDLRVTYNPYYFIFLINCNQFRIYVHQSEQELTIYNVQNDIRWHTDFQSETTKAINGETDFYLTSKFILDKSLENKNNETIFVKDFCDFILISEIPWILMTCPPKTSPEIMREN